MKKYIEWEALVALADCSKSWGSWGQSAEYFLRNAQAFTTDKVAEVIRCRDCTHHGWNAEIGNVCMKNSPAHIVPIKLDGFCSDAFPINPKI